MVAIILFGAFQFNARKTDDAPASSPSAESSPVANKAVPADASIVVPTVAPTVSQARQAVIKTDLGEIKLALYPDEAPKTVENFRLLAEKGYYKDVIFHRVIKNFMIQTGDPTGTGRGGESAFGQPFVDEFNKHKIVAGTLAMANKGPNTNGSQFFIVTEAAQPHLDGRHTVFGQVIEGMEVVKKIAAVEVDAGDKPLEAVKIQSISIEPASTTSGQTEAKDR